jgi:L-methionine (R)-S-oxide reductase
MSAASAVDPIPPAEAAGDSVRRAAYEALESSLRSALHGEPDPVARLATAAALLREALAQASFVGFYRVTEPGMLVIGPYQGPPACLRIPFGRGVCGTAAQRNESLLVPDVEEFPGHIACDGRARSELVVPVPGADGQVAGVLDLDSHQPAAFDEVDREALTRCARLLFAEEARQIG